MAGTRLEVLPAENTTWKNWSTMHPDTLVLSFATGYKRNYHVDPYAGMPLDRAPALLVMVEGDAEIFPFSQLHKAQGPVSEQLAGQSFLVRFDRHSKAARVEPEVHSRIIWFVGFKSDLHHFSPRRGFIISEKQSSDLTAALACGSITKSASPITKIRRVN